MASNEAVLTESAEGEGSSLVTGADNQESSESESDTEPPSVEEQLQQFRQQWHQEILERQVTSHGAVYQKKDVHQGGVQNVPSIEDQAKYLFLQGVNAEQSHRLHEAIQYYRRAVQLVPDIEFRIEEFKPGYRRKKRRDRQESTSSVDSNGTAETDTDDLDLDNLSQHFSQLKTNNTNSICHPNAQTPGTHISALPVEVLMYIFKWVVSSDLDIHALEQLSQVCQGFYQFARDAELWRLICYRVWGVNCGEPKFYGTWRDMFLQRPHLRFHGVYISKSSYYRQGEKSLDSFYRPIHIVEYYRYARFFPEGQMLMLTTPDDPYGTVGRLKSRGEKLQGILHGYYRITGNVMTAILKRRKVAEQNFYRYKRQQRQQHNANDGEQTFHVELRVEPMGRQAHAQLIWQAYSIHTTYRSTGETTVAEFDLNNKTYPSLIFSRVKSYTASSDAPLQ